MKNLPTYITEKLKIGKNNPYNKPYQYFPKNSYELSYKVLEEKMNMVENNILDMSDVDISNVTNLDSLFTEVNAYNPNIDTIDISGWNTSHIEYMGAMFAYCKNIKRIIGIEDLDLKSCKDMHSMFAICSSLESLDISKWNPDPQILSDISGMFDTCSSLKEIKGIESEIWEDVIVSIPASGVEQMFIKCPKLKLDLRSWYDFKDTTQMVKKCPKIRL